MARRSQKQRIQSLAPAQTVIESLAHDGRGVARVDGKTVFVHGALPGEEVVFRYTGRAKKFDEGQVESILQASENRVQPECQHFSVCGGCSLQHLNSSEQINYKQSILLENLTHIGKVAADEVLAPITGPQWNYRRKARLGVRFVEKKGRVLVGFRERASNYLTDISSCKVLHESIGQRIEELSALIGALSVRNKVPQLEIAVGDTSTTMILRHMSALTSEDIDLLTAFSAATRIEILLQSKGPDTIAPLPGFATNPLHYELPEFSIVNQFHANDFFQVNADINGPMVHKAIELLALESQDRVLDLFCGLGNFTLPISTQAAEVVGVEGSAELVVRAQENARNNGRDNVKYHSADLTEELRNQPWIKGGFDKVLLDPPRSGAFEILPKLAAIAPCKIVYVSCNPATLARDAGELVNNLGYHLQAVGVMDMFPQTAHVESIAIFNHKA